MERRTFVQVVAGTAIACGLVGVTAVQNWLLMTDETSGIGPQLISEIDILPNDQGASLFQEGQLVSRVNEFGAQLLKLADGKTPFEVIMGRADLGSPEDIALFFVTLGEAGFLRKQVQVSLVEARI